MRRVKTTIPVVALLSVAILSYSADAKQAEQITLTLIGPYIAVSHESKSTCVTLQENKPLGILDIEAGVFTQHVVFSFKGHRPTGSGLDASDQDGGINIANWPVLGIYQPDAIESYRVRDAT